MRKYLHRLIDCQIEQALQEHPAVMITGPRACGKTTTAARHAATLVRLDRPAEARVFQADPDAALKAQKAPILLDEWQEVPEVLGAVKRQVDAESSPGRYLLTGSVRADLVAETWPGTGRVIRLDMHPLTMSERLSRQTSTLIDRITDGLPLSPADETLDLRDYADLALTGGFPQPALRLSRSAQARWYESYAEQIATRDAPAVEQRRDPQRMRRFLEAFALNSAGVLPDKTIYDAAGLNRRTADAYARLLANLGIVYELPAWSNFRFKRLSHISKRFLCDCGLLAAITGIRLDGLLKDADLLGRFLETMVATELRAQTPVAHMRHRLFHLRQQQGRHEVDLLAEGAAGKVVGIEVKASAAPGRHDARHLEWLRDGLGKRFLGGVVLHTGPATYQIAEKVQAAPISCLWSEN
ncbi:MAG: DUF4143 domain-containing protein [Gammaproteobacteria bacterium]|nr:DUF4143 domain-containing protein [Gammaproteobacteria bacterium]MCY4276770.1 DUF4143 domain-containing protein [Gammaproteobacteria bacterium]